MGLPVLLLALLAAICNTPTSRTGFESLTALFTRCAKLPLQLPAFAHFVDLAFHLFQSAIVIKLLHIRINSELL